MKKIGLVIASQGYQPTEYGVPYEMLSSNGIKVITISDSLGTATAKDLTTTTVDVSLDQVDTTAYDGIFLIGGPGALEHLDTPRVHDIMQQMQALNKPYGAICISSRILAHAGVLKHKKATGWNDDNELQEIFKRSQVEYVQKPVVIDGKIVTATGPEAAQEFALGILQVLNTK